MDTFLVSLDEIVQDKSLWPRNGLNKDRVTEFAELYSADGMEALPPIVVSDILPDSDNRRTLTDGWHRVEAARRAGLTELLAEELPAEDDAEAHLQAVRLSATGSLPMTQAEKRAAVDRILREHGDMSNKQIAKVAGVSNTYVANRKREMEEGVNVYPPQNGEEAREGTPRPASTLTAEQEARRLMRGMKKVLGGGLFLIHKDRNMGKVLADAAAEEYGSEAPRRLAELARWTALAEEYSQAAPDA